METLHSFKNSLFDFHSSFPNILRTITTLIIANACLLQYTRGMWSAHNLISSFTFKFNSYMQHIGGNENESCVKFHSNMQSLVHHQLNGNFHSGGGAHKSTNYMLCESESFHIIILFLCRTRAES